MSLKGQIYGGKLHHRLQGMMTICIFQTLERIGERITLLKKDPSIYSAWIAKLECLITCLLFYLFIFFEQKDLLNNTIS